MVGALDVAKERRDDDDIAEFAGPMTSSPC